MLLKYIRGAFRLFYWPFLYPLPHLIPVQEGYAEDRSAPMATTLIFAAGWAFLLSIPSPQPRPLSATNQPTPPSPARILTNFRLVCAVGL